MGNIKVDKDFVKKEAHKHLDNPNLREMVNTQELLSFPKVAKIINDKKMADVVIKNESGTNEIFHANQKRIKEFTRLNNKNNLLQVETPTLSTRQLNGLELMDKIHLVQMHFLQLMAILYHKIKTKIKQNKNK
ncbi:hypothetical protein [Campylobacter cuniculorum]|uniref:hypothetical protein n=1 Tax=Campylobacter cuniculorum TaxID=374106 RepID=UPI0023F1CDAC|nr:hypothetical protein [Campylobacter cuniculorum]